MVPELRAETKRELSAKTLLQGVELARDLRRESLAVGRARCSSVWGSWPASSGSPVSTVRFRLRDVNAVAVDLGGRRQQADRRSTRLRLRRRSGWKTHLSSASFRRSPATGSGRRRPCGTSSRRRCGAASSAPRTPDLQPVGEVIAHVVATEWQHGHRVEAHSAPTFPVAAAVVSEPWSSPGIRHAASSSASFTSGMTTAACAAKENGGDGNAPGVLPFRCDDGALAARNREAGIGMRGLAPARWESRSAAVQSIRRAVARSCLPTRRRRRRSSAQLVKIGARDASSSRWDWIFKLVPGATPKNPASGLIAYSRPSVAELHPRDVVADGLRPSSPARRRAPSWRGWSCRRHWGTRRRCISPAPSGW